MDTTILHGEAISDVEVSRYVSAGIVRWLKDKVTEPHRYHHIMFSAHDEIGAVKTEDEVSVHGADDTTGDSDDGGEDDGS